MGIISKNREILIKILKYLNNRPGFSRLFYWIHEIRKDEIKTNNFLAFEIDEGYFLGCYNHRKHRTWRKFIENEFEINDTETVKKFIPYFDCFVDIGAHIGYYSCLVNKMRPDTTIFSFEPSKENFRSLKKNLEINNAKKSTVYNVGLGIKKEKVTLYGTDADGSILKETYPDIPEEKTIVDIDKLDNYINIIPNKAKVFIKIDVEGNEYFTLKGGSEFIKKIKPIGLIIEIVHHWSGRDNPHFFDTFSLMKDFGYDIYSIKEDAKIEKISNTSKLDGANYIFLRKDISSELENI